MSAQRSLDRDALDPFTRARRNNIRLLEVPKRRKASRTSIILWLIVSGLALFFLPAFLISSSLKQNVNNMEADISSMQRAITSVPPAPAAFREQLTPLARIQGQIQQLDTLMPTLQVGQTNWPGLMAVIGAYNTDQVAITSLGWGDNRVAISGRAVDDRSAIAYAEALQQSDLVSRVIIQSLQLNDAPVVTMTLPVFPTKTPAVGYTPHWPLSGGTDQRDQFEPDDLDTKPAIIGQSQQHSFYPAGDIDRANFLAKAGRFYRVSTLELAPGVDTVLEVRLGNQTFQNDDTAPANLASRLEFQNTGDDQTAVIAVSNRGQYGPNMTYKLLIEEIVPTPTATLTLTVTPDPYTETPTAIPTTTPVPQATATATKTPSPTPPPTQTWTPPPTHTATPPPTQTSTPPPTQTPTQAATQAPTQAATQAPTLGPVHSEICEDNNSQAVRLIGNWTTKTDMKASDGTYSYSNQQSDSALVRISGAGSFSITTITGPDRGIANIIVDGSIISTTDEYAPTSSYGVVVGPFPIPDMGQHTIQLVVDGRRNPSTQDSYVALDNFIITGGHALRIDGEKSDGQLAHVPPTGYGSIGLGALGTDLSSLFFRFLNWMAPPSTAPSALGNQASTTPVVTSQGAMPYKFVIIIELKVSTQ